MHNEIAQRIFESLDLYSLKKFDKALEISAFDQFISNYIIKNQKVKEIFTTSFNKNFCDILADDENLPFKNDIFDLVITNLNLQHINLVKEFLLQTYKILRKDGIFIASFFGEQNLFELKKAVFDAENEIYGGISPRIIPAIDVKNAANLLQKAGFKNSVSSLEIIDVEYENPMNLLRDLKFMNLGNIMLKRSKKFANRKFLDEILKNYAKIAEINGKIKARFEIIIVIGKK